MSAPARTLGLAMALALGAAALAQGASAATVIRMNHQMAANTAGGQIDQWFADEVKKRTNGEVDIKIFFGNGLGAAKETLALLENQAVDMAGLSPSYFPDQLPFFTAPNSIPMTMENLDQAAAIMPRLLKEVPAFYEEAAAKNIRPLFFHVLNPYRLVCKEPTMTTAAMKGKKIRTWGSDMPRMAEAVGAVGVNLSLTEVYESLLRGVVDCIPFSVDLMKNYKMYEVAKHYHDVTLWEGPTWGVWITNTAWNKLTPEQQKIVEAVAEEARVKDLQAAKDAAAEALGFLVEQKVEFHKWSQEEKDKWRNALPDFFGEWIAKMEAKGKGDDARKAVAIWKDVVKQHM